jgi:hypothetical protein
VTDLPEIDPKHMPRELSAFDSMTLRDWFAGQALAGLLAAHTGETALPEDKRASRDAYEYADAMLARRNTPTAQGG